MLTESEIDWFRRRSMGPGLYYCGWCMKYALCCNPQFNRCPIKDSDWQEAAIFEARVAAKLAKLDCVLKYARLAVEEEMDGYNTM